MGKQADGTSGPKADETPALRRSTRVKKPVDRYVPAPTEFIDDFDDDEECSSGDCTSNSEDDMPTEEDLKFIDNRPTKEIVAEAAEKVGSESEMSDEEEDAEFSEESSEDDQDFELSDDCESEEEEEDEDEDD